MKDTTALRDELARMRGWEKRNQTPDCDPDWWNYGADPDDWVFTHRHPIPDTLDAAHASMPEGWRWKRWGDGVWIAQQAKRNPTLLHVVDTRDPKHDLFALALECWKFQMKGKQ